MGTPDQHPEEGYWIGFTVGPVVYTVELHGPPGSVSEDRLEEIVTAYRAYGSTTEVLVASVRNVEHVRRAALLGADVCTIPPSVLDKMVQHHLTDKGLAQFLKDWETRAKTPSSPLERAKH